MAVQESVVTGASEANRPVDYYDIMIIGHTGQGKSTTADKLLIANPTSIAYTCDGDVSSDENMINFNDLSLWATDLKKIDKIETRLKSLAFSRTQKEPQKMINKIRDDEGSKKTRTTACELFSNETTRVRILDVPGFYDEEALAKQTNPKDDPDPSTFKKELAIMREIIIVQTNMNLNFERILYFLPVRGVLERAGAVVQTELKILMYFFGKQVIEKLVIVATNQKRFSLKEGGDEFPAEERKETIDNFKRCLEFLKIYKNAGSIPEVPLICISLSEPCESILAKVQDAIVAGPGNKLLVQFVPNVCRSCGMKVVLIKGKKVVCYINETESDMVPYQATSCHPMFIYDYRWYQKVLENLTHYVTFGKVKSLAKTLSVKEVCVKCNKEPGSQACLQVDHKHIHEGTEITCDHTCS